MLDCVEEQAQVSSQGICGVGGWEFFGKYHQSDVKFTKQSGRRGADKCSHTLAHSHSHPPPMHRSPALFH